MDDGIWRQYRIYHDVEDPLRERCEGFRAVIPTYQSLDTRHYAMTGFVADLQDDRIKHLEKQVERLTRYFAHHIHGPNDKLLIPMEEINELQNIDTNG